MSLVRFLGSNSYYQLNKYLVKALGSIELAMYLTHLIDLQDFLSKSNQTRDDGSFFCTQKQIEDLLFLSPYEQNKFVKILVERELIKVSREGLPHKYYFYILEENIYSLVLKIKE